MRRHAPIDELDSLDPGLRAAFGPSGEDFGEESVSDILRESLGIGDGVRLRDDPSEPGDRLEPAREAESIPVRYRVSGELARGGIGVVLKGRDVDLGRDVALKVLRAEHARNPSLTRRLVEEAQIGGQLQHPGILPIYELGLDAARRPFFAMKLVKGRTLAALLRDRSHPDENQTHVMVIFEALCHAMAYAHAKGVIHRDLKPANVMVGSFGEVQIVDWGLAKVLAKSGSWDDTRDAVEPSESAVRASSYSPLSEGGAILGTPAYMPPEQARGEIDLLDERSDVFGLGAILCEILTGRPPYEGNAHEVLDQARAGRVESAGQRLAGCGAAKELIELASRCLSVNRDDRPRDAGEVVKAVQSHREATAERARTAELDAERAKIRIASERRVRHLIVALASVVIVSLGVGGWLFFRAEHEQVLAARAEGRADRQELLALQERTKAELATLTLERERRARAEAALEMLVPLEGKGHYLLMMSNDMGDREPEKWIQLLKLAREITDRSITAASTLQARNRAAELSKQLKQREDELRANRKNSP